MSQTLNGNDDGFGGRVPTSHEQRAGKPWDASYHDEPPPWDIGFPQPAVVRLLATTRPVPPVLDVGCGTGENTLHIATLVLPVWGVDVATTALENARSKAAERGIDAVFALADALDLKRLGRRFATIFDGGLFHTFDADEKARYAASLASVTEPGGMLYILCFSDEGSDRGPHPVSQQDLHAAFCANRGWAVRSIVPERVRTRFHSDGVPAWLATVERVATR